MLSWLLPALGAIATLLTGLKAGGVNLGTVGNDALNVLDASQVDITNYEAGQAVPLANISVDGMPGTIIAVKNGGAAAASLGL